MALTVAQLVARLTADTSGFYKGMATANASMVRSGGIIKRVAAGAGIATLAMGFMAVRAAGNFQQAMNILQAVSGATGGQLKALRTEAINLGADLKLPNTSAKDAADAMTELAKGGLSVKQILTATRGTIQLSLAANEDLATSAQVVARALKAFGLGGNQATTIANLLAAAANKSTAEFSDLELGIQNASAQFTGAGYNIQTLTVALAELADKGLSGSLAGTALKVMMQRLESPTKKASAEMKRLGVSIADSQGNIRPLPVLIAQFQHGLEKLSPIQRQQALNTIFGERANAAMLKLVQQGTGGWKKYTNEIVGNNAAQKMAEARTKGFNGALQGFQSAFETLMILIGTPFLGVLTRAVNALSHFIEGLNVNAINGFIGAIFGIVSAIVGFIAHSTTMLSILGGLVAGFLAFKTILGIVSLIKGVQAAFVALNAAMFANPAVLIAAAVIALAAGLFILYERSATARRIMNEIAGFLRSTLGPAFIWLKNIIGEVASWIGQKFSDIQNFVRSHSSQISAILHAIWGPIAAFFRTTLDIIVGIFHAVWPALQIYLKTVWEVMKTIVSTGIKVIKDVIAIVMGVLHGDWSKAWHGLVNLVKDVLGGLGHIIVTILKGAAEIALTAAKDIGMAIVNGIKDGVTGAAGGLKDAVVGAAKGALGAAKSWLGIGSPSKRAADEVGKPIGEGIIVGFLLGVADLPNKMSEKLRAALQRGQNVVSAQMSVFQNRFSRLTSYVDQAFDAISQAHLGPKGRLLQKLTDAHDQAQLQGALDQAVAAVKDAQAQLSAAQSGEFENADDQAKAIADAQRALTDALAQQKEAQYQIQVAALEKEAAEEDKQYQAQRALQKQHLDDMLANFEDQMSKHPGRAAYWQKKIIETLNAAGIDYQSSGQAMGDAFAVGLKQAEKAIFDEIRTIARTIRRYLKLSSPAETGPLSDLDTWWAPFSSMLVGSLDQDAIRSAALGMANAAIVPIPGGGSAVLSPTLPTGAAAGGVQYIIPVSGNTFLTNERETLRAISNALATVAPNSDSRLQLT